MFARRLTFLPAQNVGVRFATQKVANIPKIRPKDLRARFDEPVFVHNGPAMRNYELRRSLDGNPLNNANLNFLNDKFNLISTNDAVTCVWVTSEDPLHFSSGLEKTDSKEKTAELLKISNQVNVTFNSLKLRGKETAICWSGVVDGTAFGTFANAKYRLGTDNTQVKLDVFKDSASMFGGIAHPVVKANGKHGVAVARFLAIRDKVLDADDLRELGLVSHIVEEEAAFTFQHGIGHTWGSRENIKGEQNDQVEFLSIRGILDCMDKTLAGTSGDLLNNDAPIDDCPDFSSDPVWDKIMLVTPKMAKAQKGDEDCEWVERKLILANLKDLEHCFNVENVAESKRRLGVLSGSGIAWAEETLTKMSEISDEKLNNWFYLTRFASKESLENTLLEEEKMFEKLA